MRAYRGHAVKNIFERSVRWRLLDLNLGRCQRVAEQHGDR